MSTDPLKQDFRNFLFVVWEHLNLPPPTPRQYELAYYLQHGPKRSMIQAFRGVGKSYVTSAFVCWLLYCNPLLNILVVSASKDRSDNFSIFTKRLIEEMPLLAHLQPQGKQRNSNVAFDVGPAGISHSPSVKSVGITGQLTGSRADVIVADDIESLNNSLTQIMRDQLAERIKEFDAVLKPLPTSRVIYLGTPQSEESLYNELAERGYQIRIWPARVPKNPDSYKGRLAPSIYQMIEDGVEPGTPTDPDRFNELDLREREASYGRSGFALQFMLDTSMSDADRYPLKLNDLIVMRLDPRMAPAKLVWCNDPDRLLDLPSVGLSGDKTYRPMWQSPEMAEYSGSVMAIDPSGRGKDETGYAIVKILHGNLYLVDAGGFRDGYSEETLKALAVLAKTHEVNAIRVEPNFGDGMFAQLLRPVVARIHPVEVVDDERSTGQKELRIADTLEPLMNQHRLIVDAKLIERDHKDSDPHYQLFYQLTRLTRDRGALKHDDRLDALAKACAYWIEHMSRDTENAHEEHLEKLRDQDLEKFMRGILGNLPDNDLWMRV